MADNNEIKVKSLQKALEILNLFTVKPVSVSLRNSSFVMSLLPP